MRLTSVVTGYTFGVFLLALLSGGLAFWAIDRTSNHIERMALAQASYEAHLRLSTNGFQLFKHYGNTLLTPDVDDETETRALADQIRSDIAEIRGIIATEIEMVGEEEIEELELLERLETKLEVLIRHFERRTKIQTLNEASTRWMAFVGLLGNDTEAGFRALMTMALDEEQEEVAETREELRQEVLLVTTMGGAFIVVAGGLAFAAIRFFHRNVTKPLQGLLSGVEGMERGELDKRIAVSGSQEIDQVSALLNSMATKVSERHQILEDKNTDLETIVKQRTSELERLLEEARVQSGGRQRLLADVSHELKTPLTIIRGEADIALRNRQPEVSELQEALRRSKVAAEHTSAIVDDLLLISRQESGELKLKKEASNLSRIVQDAVALSPIVSEISEPDGSIPVSVDRLRLRQALLAVLQNANNHGATTTIITLSENGDTCEISVADNGPGMSDAEKQNAFARFYRGSNAGGNRDAGYGLGLPIVKSIVEAHGGLVKLSDSEFGGLQVLISLPLRAPLRSVS